MKTIQIPLLGLAALCACTSTYHSLRTEESPGTALPRSPQPPPPEPSPQEPSAQAEGGNPTLDKITLPIGLGVTSGPHTNMIAAAVDFPIGGNWSIGPAVEFGVTDNRTLVTALFQAKRFFPLSSDKEGVRRLLPYALVGVGLATFEEDVGAADADDAEAVFAIGGGARYSFTDRLTLGSELQFNFLPSDLRDENFYTSWEIVQIVFAF